MGIKRVYLLMICLLPYYIFCQATEEQSKLTGTDIDLVGELIVFDGQLGSLSVHRHDNYIYRDIYFDTPDFDLYNSGYSLRIRSRYFNADSIVYAIQLKSEMTNISAVRMEVEEADLDIYTVSNGETRLPLTTLLNRLFQSIDTSTNFIKTNLNKQDVALLHQWMSFKSESTITPFQTLHAIFPDDKNLIDRLQPVTFGSEYRSRCHLYISIDSLNEKDLIAQPLSQEDVPIFFNEHPEYIWVAEGSYDEAQFISLLTTNERAISIIEFEIENKLKPETTGTTLIEACKSDLIKDYRLSIEYRSKYRQAVEGLGLAGN